MVCKSGKMIGVDDFSESLMLCIPSIDALCLQLIRLAKKYHVNNSETVHEKMFNYLLNDF